MLETSNLAIRRLLPEAVKADVRLVSRLLGPEAVNSGDHTLLSGPDALWLSSWRETSNKPQRCSAGY